MTHSHAHSHRHDDGRQTADELFTILTCAGIGVVAILMYRSGMLERILVPMFFVPVLIGGIAVLALTAIRALAVWGLPRANVCSIDHSHGPDCAEHHWAPWRYAILAVPVFLYFLGFPHAGFVGNIEARPVSLDQSPKRAALAVVAGGPALTNALRRSEPRRMQLGFKELALAAAIPSRHEIYDGHIGILRGEFVPVKWSDREFTLLRVDRTCCYADETYLQARIETPDAIQGIKPKEWIRVEGLISFRKDTRGTWIAVISLASNDDVARNVEPTNDANAP